MYLILVYVPVILNIWFVQIECSEASYCLRTNVSLARVDCKLKFQASPQFWPGMRSMASSETGGCVWSWQLKVMRKLRLFGSLWRKDISLLVFWTLMVFVERTWTVNSNSVSNEWTCGENIIKINILFRFIENFRGIYCLYIMI